VVDGEAFEEAGDEGGAIGIGHLREDFDLLVKFGLLVAVGPVGAGSGGS
jgi:hypothetical protein